MAYDVHLEIFEGPLELLLYLIKKNDLEIAEIPIAQITSEYVGYLEMMKDLNLEIAGEFLVMASTLMQIKARTLLPSEDVEEEEGPNPLEELKSRLLEYQKYKQVARVLSEHEEEAVQYRYRTAPPVFDKEEYVLQVSLFDLLESFKNIVTTLPTNVREIVYKEIPIEQKIRELLDTLDERGFMSFGDVFRRETSRHGVVVSFMAVLELIRLKQIVALQSALFDDIRIYRVGSEVLPRIDTPGPGPVDGTPEPAAEQDPLAREKVREFLKKKKQNPLAMLDGFGDAGTEAGDAEDAVEDGPDAKEEETAVARAGVAEVIPGEDSADGVPVPETDPGTVPEEEPASVPAPVYASAGRRRPPPRGYRAARFRGRSGRVVSGRRGPRVRTRGCQSRVPAVPVSAVRRRLLLFSLRRTGAARRSSRRTRVRIPRAHPHGKTGVVFRAVRRSASVFAPSRPVRRRPAHAGRPAVR